MSTATQSYFEIASNLPPSTEVTFHEVSWEEYEQCIEELGEAPGRRVTFYTIACTHSATQLQ